MVDRSEHIAASNGGAALQDQDVGAALRELTQVLLHVASARFDVRARRSYRGDPLDVLAFLVNATAEEVEHLVMELRQEQALHEQAKDRLAQTEKLAALGELSGGVAHELNQPLTAIKTLVEMMMRRPESTISECLPDLELIERAVERMGKIVLGIRTFARAEGLPRERIRAVEPLSAAARLLGPVLGGKTLVLSWRLPEHAPEILGDSARLEQVFINLIHNAMDALEDGDQEGRAGKTILLSVTSDGPWVVYDVEDNGPGVADEIAHRVFDPFFTTKPVGRGTGLGLSVSHGIVREHGGSIHCQRSTLGGARFTVRLPRACNGENDGRT